MSNKSDNKKLILLGGLWVNESSNGVKYMSGRLGLGGKILIFRNLNADKPNAPEYMLYLAPYEKAQSDDPSDIEF